MKNYRVITKFNGKDVPRPHEKIIAKHLTNYFESDIEFIRRRESKTPDLLIIKNNIRWELKSPIGGGKHTIQNNLRNIDYQSENVILDLTRSKLTDRQGVSRTKEFLKNESNRIKRLKIILKSKQIIDIK